MGRSLACALVLVALAAARADAANCTISTTSIVFGAYDVFASGPADSTGTVRYECNGNAQVVIAISRGLSGTFSSRQLGSGTERLAYNLYRDAARTAVWGDFTEGTTVLFDRDPPKKTEVTATIYGRIPQGQDVSAGSYSDTVTVIVLF